MRKDLNLYFLYLAKYLKGRWGLLLLGVSFGIVSELCTLISPLLTKYLTDFVIIARRYSYFKPFILLSIGILLTYLITSLISNYILIKLFKQISAKLRTDMFEKLQQAPIDFFEKETSGGIVYRLFGDTDVLVNSWSRVVVSVPMQIILFISAIFMVKWNLPLALFTFTILIIQAFIITRFRKPILNYAKLIRAKGQQINGFAADHFRRIDLIRSFNTEEFEKNKFFEKIQALIRLEIKSFIISKFSGILQILISNIWSLSVLFYGGMLVIKGRMTVGTLMAFIMFGGILYRPISNFTNLILSFQQTRVSLKRVKDYLDLKPYVLEKPNAIKFAPKRGIILVENVSFEYQKGIKILKDVNIEFPPNSITVITGQTGSGKTTFAKLLARFYDPLTGSILIDGVDEKNIKLSSIRKTIRLFPYGYYVFNGTVYDNITYGINNPTEDEIKNALKDAMADFVYTLPSGLNTYIGEGGINISAGEAQRIALARAFLAKAKIFIFDEPTSFVDVKTENEINKSFIKLKQRATIIIITHRINTVKIADKIAVISKRSIRELNENERNALISCNDISTLKWLKNNPI